MSNFFGTDGIRGEVGKSPITADVLLKVGWAVGSVLKEQNENASVIIGKDTRVSGYLFESALEAGFLSAGVNVGMLGPMPSPAIAYLTQAFGATAGVVISASHNPFQDNGVKFFSSKGVKLSDDTQKAIEKKISMPMTSVDSASIGKAKRYEQAVGRYIEFCKSTFDKSCDLSNLNIIIDCANGATYHIAEDVFTELGAVTMINNSPDGYNINRDCGATDTKHLQKVVLEKNADLGIAFDGDGDRLIMVDHKGHQVDGDELVFIIANAWKESGDLKSKTVVGTKMTNLGIQSAFADAGISFIEADVGDRHVMNQLIKHKAVLGGEGSGHIICLNKSTSGDGIIAALQVLEVMSKTGKNLNDLKSRFTKYPQVLINIKTKSKVNLQGESNLTQAVNSIESKLSNTGRILIRESGTEALIRVMVESANYKLAKDSAEELAEIIKTM